MYKREPAKTQVIKSLPHTPIFPICHTRFFLDLTGIFLDFFLLKAKVWQRRGSKHTLPMSIFLKYGEQMADFVAPFRRRRLAGGWGSWGVGMRRAAGGLSSDALGSSRALSALASGGGGEMSDCGCSLDGCATRDADEAWWAQWNSRIDDWWLAFPGAREGMQSCFSALGIHLASRLDSALRAWRARIGEVPPPTRLPSGAAVPEGCEWVGADAAHEALQLPEFPDFGELDFELLQVIPIPRLLPDLQLWESHGLGQLISDKEQLPPMLNKRGGGAHEGEELRLCGRLRPACRGATSRS